MQVNQIHVCVSCDHHQGVTRHYKQYTNNCKNVQLKPLDVTVNIFSTPRSHKISN